jgi:LmbE family N-acetylglucosaminyl deacetylase
LRNSQQKEDNVPVVLALMAHPDDIEFTCAGTLALLARAGWSVHMATMTGGDLGSMTLAPQAIARLRRREAAASAAILSAPYTCLGFRDLTIVYNERAKRRVCALIRQVRPDLIVTHPPRDYMADHEETARIAREAAFASTVPNWRAILHRRQPPPCARVAGLLYSDPLGIIDAEGRRVPAGQVVDITAVIAIKERMLAAHASQRDWLRRQHGEDEYLQAMRRWAAERARDFGRRAVRYAEGFQQHLGHGFPHTDLLTLALGKNRVKTVSAPALRR